MGRFLADFGSMLGVSGDHLGMIWACSGVGVCSFLRRIRPSGSGTKINFDKNSVPAWPARTGVCRDPGFRYLE